MREIKVEEIGLPNNDYLEANTADRIKYTFCGMKFLNCMNFVLTSSINIVSLCLNKLALSKSNLFHDIQFHL